MAALKLQSISTKVICAVLITSLLTSCFTTMTNVGQYKETQGQVYTYAKGKQLWLFWGLIPLGRTSVNTPADGNCRVITQLTLVDYAIIFFTGGVLASYTIKVKAKKEVPKNERYY